MKNEKVLWLELPEGLEYRKVTVTDSGKIGIVYTEKEQSPIEETTKAQSTTNVVQGPTEGKWFKVNPKAIDQTLFEKERKDEKQENTRQLILEAFAEVKENPDQYGKPFETMFPEKDWGWQYPQDLREMAEKLGDHLANKVEQSLEWAQRIANGESWEAVCNNPDTANWYRVVNWDGHYELVGGWEHSAPASRAIRYVNHDPAYFIRCTVPLVVRYK